MAQPSAQGRAAPRRAVPTNTDGHDVRRQWGAAGSGGTCQQREECPHSWAVGAEAVAGPRGCRLRSAAALSQMVRAATEQSQAAADGATVLVDGLRRCVHACI